MVNYLTQLTAMHKKYSLQLKKAQTRGAVTKAYIKHKKDHSKMLKKHLKEELADVRKVKSKLPRR
ncbi:hypothetical protein CENSYa_0179 [Cenarchaeum symbiosum A]|uniref:Uncharacterized protein n=1 Tax=Cenarchaeum symbiosum (strain A) TaxID=414004 RepID=A0RU07_CENSY|nr:hypothetical protein CENSYa_0179 [Cenarchaeum symbiosum A]